MKTIAVLCALCSVFCMNAVAKPVKIEDIDKNFRVGKVNQESVHFFNALQAPFQVTGFPFMKDGVLRRLPAGMRVGQYPDYTEQLALQTSGGAIRFRSDTPALYIRATLYNGSDMGHMARTGTGGFDVFMDAGTPEEEHISVVSVSSEQMAGKKEVVQRLHKKVIVKMRNYTVYLPMYCGVKSLEIGVEPGHKILPPLPQRIEKPIVFYGSSITQGACASRPASNYSTLLCRAVDAPEVNLGFSGIALGEIELAQMIGGMTMSAFVMDYDYNAPSPWHIRDTHERFFLEIRKKQPNLPIIIISRCTTVIPAQRDWIRKTYENAVARGDKHVWFIDGTDILSPYGLNASVDGIHPNDLGFFRMYEKILPILKEALESK